MATTGECERKDSNESASTDRDAISLYYDDDFMGSDGELSKKRSRDSMQSLDEYIDGPKRWCNHETAVADAHEQGMSNDTPGTLYESLHQLTSANRISVLFSHLQIIPMTSLPSYILHLCDELLADGRMEDLKRLFEMIKPSPVRGQNRVFDYVLQRFQGDECQYSDALRRLINLISGPSTSTINYIVDKIVSPKNDKTVAFLDDLKTIAACGFKFNPILINKLMDFCIHHFDMNFHQFVLTKVVNKLTKDELDEVNETILDKFASRRLAHVNKMGLSRNIHHDKLKLLKTKIFRIKTNYSSICSSQGTCDFL